MRNLWVELDAMDWLLRVPHGGDRNAATRRRDYESRWRRVDVVAMAHPGRHGLVSAKPVEQSDWLDDLQLGASVFTTPRADYLSAGKLGDELHAVANGERRCEVEDRRIDGRRAFLVNRVRSAAK